MESEEQRKLYEKETGKHWLNTFSCFGPSVEYVEWLEDKIATQQYDAIPCNQHGKQSSVISVCPTGKFECGLSPCMITRS
jgi:hypothetical protein